MWHDLTRVMDSALAPYAAGDYADPALAIGDWTDIPRSGFAVQQLVMGTQTGTHTDAPAHMHPGGATLEALPAPAFVGAFAYLSAAMLAAGQAPVGAGAILYLDALDGPAVDPAAVDALIGPRWPVWVMAGGLRLTGGDPLHLHRALARAGVWLVEDLDEAAARIVTGPGEIIALPLRLSGASGAPTRVLVRRNVTR